MYFRGVMKVLTYFICIVALPVFVSARGNHGGSASDYKGVYLSGYYRSGSYWMNRVLEDITGITSTSVEYNRDYYRKKFPWGGYARKGGYNGTCRLPEPGDVVVIKNHFPDKERLYPNILVLIRFPFDSIHSWTKHPYILGKCPNRETFVRAEAQRWKGLYEAWGEDENVTMIRYEDLLFDTENQLERLCNAVDIKTTPQKIRQAVEHYPPFGDPGKHLHHFSDNEIVDIINIIGRPLLEKYGYLELLKDRFE